MGLATGLVVLFFMNPRMKPQSGLSYFSGFYLRRFALLTFSIAMWWEIGRAHV